MPRSTAQYKIIPGMINVGFWSLCESLCHTNQYFIMPGLGAQENNLRKFNDLYSIGKRENINFISLDLVKDFNALDLLLFCDFPRLENNLVKKAFASGKPMFLILEECEAVSSENWKSDNHRFFEKIFTWHDNFVDNKKYFKFNIHFIETRTLDKNIAKKEKLCTLIASNKSMIHHLELYSKRREAIRWFERNHPEDFDLYGHDWNVYNRPVNSKVVIFGGGKTGRNNLKMLIKKLLAPRYPSWKGEIVKKRPILEKYKFGICYENARDIPGYIAEKIFDCFAAATVPVYWGANNITDHIPESCFVDKRKFETYEQLYRFMKSMKDAEYLRYLDAIEEFLNSEKSYQFTSDYFAHTVIKEIKSTLAQETKRNLLEK